MGALALRLYGIDWDQGYHYHPDERFLLLFKVPEIQWPIGDLWSSLLDPATSSWNPRWFAYGSFPFYQLYFLNQLAPALHPDYVLDDLRFLGRGLSALFDVGAIFLTYLLGARLFGWRTGLLAAAFGMLAVIHIQLSHFAAFDVQLVFWVLVALYGAARVLERPDLPGVLLTGAGLGLALATKTSVLPLIIPIATAYLLYGCTEQSSQRLQLNIDPARVRRALWGLAGTAGVAALLFVIAMPYALLDWATFTRDVLEQSEMAMRIRDYPYTRQYVDTTPYLYHIQQLISWGFGIPLGLLAWLGLVLACLRGLRNPHAGDLLLLAWVLPYFLFIGATPVKYLRYLLPITPVLLLLAAHVLVLWWESSRPRERALSPVAPRLVTPRFYLALVLRRIFSPAVVTVIVLTTTAWYALAFTNIYQEAHPATRLSEWVNEHVPKGSVLLKEHWGEGVPRLEQYQIQELPLYEPDDAAKLGQLVHRLEGSDYVVFFSNRLYGTIPRLPERYPLTSRYYRLLFSGDLGYRLVHTSNAEVSFLGVTWRNDTFTRPGLPPPEGISYPSQGLVLHMGYADESFTVYDHPMTLLFKKEQALSAPELTALLQPALFTDTPSGVREGPLLTPQDVQTQRAGGTWSHIFQTDSLPNQHPWFTWLLTIEVLGLLAFPLAFWLFQAFPDRGFLLAKGLGILGLAYGSWLLASLQWLPFTQSTIVLVGILLALMSVLLLLKQRTVIVRHIRERWRLLLGMEGLFLLAFIVFYQIRLANPDLWHPWLGGEKPMDFAYLNAVIRSTIMPAYDPWYSGGMINYYYFGQVIVGTLIKLTGILPEIAYNLAIPTLFALTVGHAASLGSALLAAQRASLLRGRALLAAGASAAVAVAVVGNLDGLVQVLENLRNASDLDFVSTIPGLEGGVKAAAGLWNFLGGQIAPGQFDYWRSRSLGGMDPGFIDPALQAPSISITEFPFFTFLFADLHAHLIALPFTVLAAAFALQTAIRSQGSPLLRRLALLLTFGLVLGALRWTNTWDFPTYLALGLTAVAISRLAQWSSFSLGAVLIVIFQALFLAGSSLLLFRPFESAFEVFYSGGLQPSPEATPLLLYLRMYGLYLTVLVGFVVYEIVHRFNNTPLLRLARLALARPAHAVRVVSLALRLGLPPGRARFSAIAAVLLIAALVVLVGATSTVGFLLLLLGALALLAWRESTRPTERGSAYLFALALAAGAASLSLVVDVVKLDIPGEVQRMNNVFKLYFQVWTLYALSAAYALWWVLGGLRRSAPPASSRWPAFWRRAWLTGVAILVASSLVYPLMATPVRVADRFAPTPPTNNGMEFMRNAVYNDEHGPIELRWDYRAIQWLREHVQGSPVILEGNTPIYRWGSRVSIYTGLPTILGWDWHQTQQRWGYPDGLHQRKADVTTLYSTSDIATTLALLHRYQVEYVYVGELERLYYPVSGIDKFHTMTNQGMLQAIYQNSQVTIYRVCYLAPWC